ncbi:MAG: hypothetical protein MJ200_03395 [Mycoplasmoidaceae bacterium]|nr:hypothetical protein [Mycoplasmoidaceae bacterium]
MASNIQTLIEKKVEHVTISILDINASKKIVSIKFAISRHEEEDGSLWCNENTISNIPVEVTYDNATST